MRYWLALLLSFLLAGQGRAEGVPLTLDDGQARVELAEHLYVAVDPEAHLGVDAVRGLDRAGQLRPATARDLRPGYSAAAHWFRLELRNPADRPLVRWLEVRPARLQEVTLFLPDGVMEAGTRQAFERRPLASPTAMFPLELGAGQTLSIYLRVASETAISVSPVLWSPDAYERHAEQIRLIDGGLYGATLLGSVFGVLLFLALRERVFLFVSAATIMQGLYSFSMSGYGFMYLWPHATTWATRCLASFSSGAVLFMLLYMRDYLATPSRLPRWDRLLRGLVVLHLLVIGGLLLGDYRQFAALSTLLNLAGILAIITIGVATVRKGYRDARLYTAAIAMIMLAALPRILEVFGLLKPAASNEYALQFVTLLATMLMLAAVVERLMRVRHDKEAAQAELLRIASEHEALLELAVQERTAALAKALAETRAANAARTRLLAYISHDLRAPLATIVNYVHLLSRHATPETARYQETIERCAAQQLELIDDLVEYARGELDRLEIIPAPHYLPAFVRDVAVQGELLAARNRNAFLLAGLDELPAAAVFDAKRLRQVLINLLANAAKFTHDGTIRLEVEANVEDGRVRLRFTVADTGGGIAPSDRERVFTPFERLSEAVEGHGLGLAIVRQVAEKIGGSLSLESETGAGSRFAFDIALPSADEREVLPPAPNFPMPDPFGTGRTLLIADDNPDCLDYLHEIYAAADFRIVRAADGAEALAAIRDEHIDALVVDQEMPEADGWELLRALRTTHPHASAVLYSATSPHRPAGFPAGMDFDAALLKPASPAQMLDALRGPVARPGARA